MRYESDSLEIKNLDKLLKALKGKQPYIRIGVMGEKINRNAKEGQKKNPTNAEIGAAHEFGSPARGLPIRSFLRMPLTDFLNKELESQKAFGESELKEVLKASSIIPWLKKIAVVAEGIVLGAFDSGGYGKWKSWKDKNYINNAGMLLVDTTQLRDSITSEVKE